MNTVVRLHASGLAPAGTLHNTMAFTGACATNASVSPAVKSATNAGNDAAAKAHSRSANASSVARAHARAAPVDGGAREINRRAAEDRPRHAGSHRHAPEHHVRSRGGVETLGEDGVARLWTPHGVDADDGGVEDVAEDDEENVGRRSNAAASLANARANQSSRVIRGRIGVDEGLVDGKDTRLVGTLTSAPPLLSSAPSRVRTSVDASHGNRGRREADGDDGRHRRRLERERPSPAEGSADRAAERESSGDPHGNAHVKGGEPRRLTLFGCVIVDEGRGEETNEASPTPTSARLTKRDA